MKTQFILVILVIIMLMYTLSSCATTKIENSSESEKSNEITRLLYDETLSGIFNEMPGVISDAPTSGISNATSSGISNAISSKTSSTISENGGITDMLLPIKFWAGKNKGILNDPLEEEILNEWTSDGVSYKEVYFTSRKVSGGTVRVYAIYGAPESETNLPTVLHIHGGGQTVSQDWIKYWANRGYACLSIDWGGRWSTNPSRTQYTKYPESLIYANHEKANHNIATPNAEDNCWYEWTYICRRALSYLSAQKQVNHDKIGIYGISMGGTLCWIVAGSDSRVKAVVPIYGAGYEYDYRRYPLYGTGSQDPTTYIPSVDTKRFLIYDTPEAYAPYIKAPLLYLSASNDFHGNMDWVCKTYDSLPAKTIHSISFGPGFNHHIYKEQENNLPLWMDLYLKEKNMAYPENPKIIIQKNKLNKPEILLNTDDSTSIKSIEIYYGLETIDAFNRYWQLVKPINEGNGNYSVSVDVMDTTKYLFAYASVLYANGFHLSTTVALVKPNDIGCTKAAAKKSNIVYSSSEGIDGWACDSIGTDPIPPETLPLKIGNEKDLGMTINKSGVSPWTYRLNDPRFAAPSNDSKLKFNFKALYTSTIKIKMHNTAYIDSTPYAFSTEISNLNSSFTINLSELKNDSGKTIGSWSLIPVLEIVKMNSNIILTGIEWVE